MIRFLFVGERRSATALARGVTWVDGRLCGSTLHRALRAAGIDPHADCLFLNLFRDDDPADWTPKRGVLAAARIWRQSAGGPVVALGARVARVLERAGVEHVRLTHPAARGSIRKTERYQAHVAAVLGGAA